MKIRNILIISLTLAMFNVFDANAQNKHLGDIQMINDALKTSHISRAERAEVIKLRNEGSKYHYSGDHANAEIVLEQAKAILHIN